MLDKNEQSPQMNILIPDADSPFTRQVAISLKKSGRTIYIIACFNHRNSIRACKKYIDKTLLISPECNEEYFNKLINLHSVDIVLPVSMEGIEKFSKFKTIKTKPEHPEKKYLDICKDKYNTSIFLDNLNILTPETKLLHHVNTINNTQVIKPRDSSGGNGCHIVKSHKDLLKYKSIYKDHICQEYIEGYDVGCSVFCVNGRLVAHTIQKPARIDHFSPRCSKITFIYDENILGVVSELIKNLSWNGVAHIDLRYDSDGNLYVLEINPGFWASLMASTHSGINFPEIIVDYTLGRKITKTKKYKEINYIPLRYIYNIFFYKDTASDAKTALSDPAYLFERVKNTLCR